MDSISLSLKDFALIISLLSTGISIFYALKYKAIRNGEKNEETADSFTKFKEFVERELKEIDDEMKKFNLHISELLRKDDAEERYISRKEHKLVMENIDQKIDLILDAVKTKG